MPRPLPALAVLATSPMAVAVEVHKGGHAWAGRVGNWALGPDGWWADVSPEQAAYRAGERPGWYHERDLSPAQHATETTFGTWEWWSWTPTSWPEALSRFAGAAWNRVEQERAASVRSPRGRPRPSMMPTAGSIGTLGSNRP